MSEFRFDDLDLREEPAHAGAQPSDAISIYTDTCTTNNCTAYCCGTTIC